jgi:hypothetical protein
MLKGRQPRDVCGLVYQYYFRSFVQPTQARGGGNMGHGGADD